jgi:hypothetical protein
VFDIVYESPDKDRFSTSGWLRDHTGKRMNPWHEMIRVVSVRNPKQKRIIADLKRHLKSKHGQQKSTLKQQQPYTPEQQQQQPYTPEQQQQPYSFTPEQQQQPPSTVPYKVWYSP